MLTSELLDLVDKYTPNSKVILVGDICQLAPVGERGIPAFTRGYPTATLTEPMRQDKNSDLFKLCQHLRSGVENNTWKDVFAGKDVEIIEDGATYLERIKSHFSVDRTARVITYTNKQAINHNAHIREALGFPEHFVIDDAVVSRKFTKSICESAFIGVEESSVIVEIHNEGVWWGIRYVEVMLEDGNMYRMALNKYELDAAISRAKSEYDWPVFFKLQEGFVDLRAGFGITSHSSQGSTYDTVFIDLPDIKTCRQLDTLVRMIYVSVSRAKKKVIIYSEPHASY